MARITVNIFELERQAKKAFAEGNYEEAVFLKHKLADAYVKVMNAT